MRNIAHEDIKLWIQRDALIDQNNPEKGMDFNKFKRNFFPRLYQNYDRTDIVGGPDQQWEQTFVKDGQAQQKVVDRLQALDKLISRKLSTVWVSVRKAFLELDQDRDGLIDAEDIARYFGEEEPIDLMDLRTLMTEKKRMRERTML